MLRAIQYKTDDFDNTNLRQIVENFGLDAEEVSVNFKNRSVKLGKHNGTRLHIGQWMVLDSETKQTKIIDDSVAQAILSVASVGIPA